MFEDNKVTYFGETDFRNNKTRFGIKAKDRTKHLYIIGKTGMGKSTLLENLAIQDIQNDEGIIFVDPHGSSAVKLLEYVPRHRIDDVIYFAPHDSEFPIAFNPLEQVPKEKRNAISGGIISTLKKIWVDSFSSRMEYILNYALLALLEVPGQTFLGVNRILGDKVFRKYILDRVDDPLIKNFWLNEFERYSATYASEAIAPIQNKVGQFIASPMIRNIIGQDVSTIDFRAAMDQKKIVIINISKGIIGPENMRLLGGMLITKIQIAAMSRANLDEEALKRIPPTYLYVDEFQNFANESFAEILSESRKYKLCLTVANQYIDQMTEEVRNAVIGNVGTFISFRVGSADAEIMEREFAPAFMAEDMVNLGQYQMYLKLMIDGVGSRPFSATNLPPINKPERSYVADILGYSRKHYSKEKEVIENEIRKWTNKDFHLDNVKFAEDKKSKDKKTEEPPRHSMRDSDAIFDPFGSALNELNNYEAKLRKDAELLKTQNSNKSEHSNNKEYDRKDRNRNNDNGGNFKSNYKPKTNSPKSIDKSRKNDDFIPNTVEQVVKSGDIFGEEEINVVQTIPKRDNKSRRKVLDNLRSKLVVKQPAIKKIDTNFTKTSKNNTNNNSVSFDEIPEDVLRELLDL